MLGKRGVGGFGEKRREVVGEKISGEWWEKREEGDRKKAKREVVGEKGSGEQREVAGEE